MRAVKGTDSNWAVNSGYNGRIRGGESDFEGTFMALVGIDKVKFIKPLKGDEIISVKL